MSQQISTFGLRLPDNIRLWIGQRSKQNRRSINSEILFLLSTIKANDEQTSDGKMSDEHPELEKPMLKQSCGVPT